ncbi:putative Glycosyltransferase [Thiomonas sp. X19]|uniref:glycosyltransferase n=1 Tax=Thiomonas sp. X19 TaxID=1050370 RepID=UPI000B74A0AF|nr:glycosyltransferase [Thiomonas sp. X19]SCC91529.1 putative Glycosyltransferase [Thiomonas sp. X19]
MLIVTDEMEVGGTQRQIVQMVLGLDRSRFEPTVLYFRNRSFFVDQLEQAGVPVLLAAKHARIDPGFVRRLRQTVAAGAFDVMHCFALTGELWGAVVHALIPARRKPVLLSSIRNTYDWERPLHRRIKQWVMRRSWQVVANSEAGALSARHSMKLPPGLIRVIYNGVTVPELAPQTDATVRTQLGIELNTPLILFVGRLVEQKDVATLIRAMARLRNTHARLIIAGDGPLRPALEQQTGLLGLSEQVHFLGQRHDAAALMSAANLVVLPSLVEGLSNVILEGMMCGRPVIASHTGGNVELVEHERTGLLFHVGDDAALAACIQRLIDNPEQAVNLGRAARDKALRCFSMPAMVAAFATLYEEAATLRCAPRP